jgi:hypothetical protein
MQKNEGWAKKKEKKSKLHMHDRMVAELWDFPTDSRNTAQSKQ